MTPGVFLECPTHCPLMILAPRHENLRFPVGTPVNNAAFLGGEKPL